ncbi:formate dehydrogenase subunit gamma [Roseomonas alkaliterrae]|uniref:Formate dehydrogenase subunit gamma n=1 Tax=Neoroseomonas alkaliterrae TaxID=1452450 RepID=A0A840XXZ9_9PROT|nr:formate dehydrogenase subunit gamma [Neoroseomonas alkaliterrae]MBB5691489.1 formate dehydrogenase subunit gamma [Neoroseomonas alkaliterrae]MBR0677842.1 formate dehydrogenase subunit gamma [Neoroseomonas alkaliterrae]
MRALFLAFALLLAAPVAGHAQTNPQVTGVPGNPTPMLPPVADELEVLKALQGGRVAGRITIPDQQAANLIQPAGRSWRDFHNVTLAWVGGVAVLGMLGILVLFRLSKGRIPIEGGPSGRTIQRFNLLERANHWMVASTFIILALSGLNLTFGRHILLPIVGPEAFTAISQWGKYAHNFLAFPFTLGLVLMLLLWIKDNIPNGTDIRWLKAGGGLIGNAHPDSGRFNAGQKGIFWITILGGAAVAVTGYMLVFPFMFTDIAGMQLSHMIHSIVSVLMIAVMLAHIYIGTIGMEGASAAMTTGQVDLNWAKQHHNLWVEKELASGRGADAPGTAKAAGAD